MIILLNNWQFKTEKQTQKHTENASHPDLRPDLHPRQVSLVQRHHQVAAERGYLTSLTAGEGDSVWTGCCFFWLVVIFHDRVLKRLVVIFRDLSSLLTTAGRLAGVHVDRLNRTHHQCGNTEECYSLTDSPHTHTHTHTHTHVESDWTIRTSMFDWGRITNAPHSFRTALLL